MRNRLPNSIFELTAKDRRGDDLWVSEISYYLMWLEFLAISPSYELARKVRAGEMREEDAAKRPEDFDRVLAVFDDLGDVQKVLFRPWWKQVGLRHFGYQGTPPEVKRIAYIPHAPEQSPDISADVQRFMEEDWLEQGCQRTMLLAVPVGLSDANIIRTVKLQLAKVKKERRQLIKPPAKYPIVGQRHHKDALLRYLRTVLVRSAMHTKALWRVGAQAQVSSTYSPTLDPKAELGPDTDRSDRQILTVITSRALLRARLIAENAARGLFPTHEPCPNALDFDYSELRRRIQRRNKWQANELKLLMEAEQASATQ